MIKNKQPTWKLKKSRDAKMADDRIKYCSNCKRCWEILSIGDFTKEDKNVNYYNDFPTYGKQKQTCYKCKGETNGEIKSTRI